MLTRLILIRHGITTWNKQERYCGCKDINLSKEGRAQAEKLCKILKKVKFERIYSSDRKRALQTSRIVFPDARIIKVKALREINFGVLEGFTHEEIMKKYAPIYQKWLNAPFKYCLPKAEPLVKFKKRIQDAVKKIVRLNRGKTMAIICHGGSIGILVGSILKSKNFWRYVPSAASMTILEYKNDRPRIKKFNQKNHLR